MAGTRIDEIADQVYRVSTFIEAAGLCFNQYLLVAEEPLLFHTGQRALFPAVVQAVSSVLPPAELRWVTFGHLEADECGSMNQWLAAAPDAQVAASPLANMVSLLDLCDRPPHALASGEVLDLGGRRVRSIDTPHVPHGWDARILYEETSGMLLCGDLFTAVGMGATSTDQDVVGPAVAAEDVFGATCITPSTGPTIRRLAELEPTSLALMHGPVFTGDCVAALHALADDYDRRLAELIPQQL